jgi:hypothetical protein
MANRSAGARNAGAIRRPHPVHRGRGQQQITVKHVTTNNVTADQAIIADSVTTGGAARGDVASPALLAASSGAPMPILDEARLSDLVGVGGGTKPK